MARRPRIEQVGYYQIINRGVNKMNVFRHPDDYAYLEELWYYFA